MKNKCRKEVALGLSERKVTMLGRRRKAAMGVGGIHGLEGEAAGGRAVGPLQRPPPSSSLFLDFFSFT